MLSFLSCRPSFRRTSSSRLTHLRKPAILAACLGLLATAPTVRAQTAYAGGTLTVGTGWSQPAGIAVDAHGNVYVADTANSAVKEIVAVNGVIPLNPTIVTLGSGFNQPSGVAVDGSGNVYVADTYNLAVKEIMAVNGAVSPTSAIRTFFSNGFGYPSDVAVDSSGNVYFANPNGGLVKEMLAVNGSIPANPTIIAVGGGFSYPYGLAVDRSGNVYVADWAASAVKEIVAVNGTVSAASTVVQLGTGFNDPRGVAVDAFGNVYVADRRNSAVKEIVAVNGTIPSANAVILTLGSGLTYPSGVAVDSNGNVFVAEYGGNNNIAEIASGTQPFPATAVGTTSASQELLFTFTGAGTLAATPYVVLTQGALNLDYKAASTQSATQCITGHTYNLGDTCTVDVTFSPTRPGPRYGAVQLMSAAGLPIATFTVHGSGTGPMVTFPSNTTATTLPSGTGFSGPSGVAVDGNGNVYVTDTNNHAVKKITAINGAVSANSNVLQLPGGFYQPTGVAVDGSGNVYVADTSNNVVKEIVAVNGAVSASSGVLQLPGGSGGFSQPAGVAVDGSGNVYVADSGRGAVREVFAVNGTVSAASNVVQLPTGSGFYQPLGVAVDGSGNVYVADTFDNAMKEIVAVNGTIPSNAAVITLSRGFTEPFGVAVDGSGNVYVAVTSSNVVKEIVAVNGAVPTSNPIILTLGGGFSNPGSVAVDGSGNVYVGDVGNNVVKELPFGTPPSLSFASTAAGATSTDSPQSVSVLNDGNAPLIFNVPASGANPAFNTLNFPLASGSATTCPQLTSSYSGTAPTLAAGASCMYGFNFSPQVVGTLTDRAILYNNSLNLAPATQTIGLSGTATGSQVPSITNNTITISPATLLVGSYATVTVHVTNGTYGLQGYSVSVFQNASSYSSTLSYLSGSTGTSDSNGNVILSVTDTTAGTVTLTSGLTGGQGARVTFVNPTYLVTTLTDDVTGHANNCVVLATDNSGGNAACSLRDAIAAANALPTGMASTINFAAPLFTRATRTSPAVYQLSSTNGGLTINTAATLTVNGPTGTDASGSFNQLALDGGNPALTSTTGVQVLNITGNTTLNNLVVRNGLGNGDGGGIQVNSGTVTLSGMTISGSRAVDGGGIAIEGGTVTLSGTTISANNANGYGGGLFLNHAAVTLSNVTIAANTTSAAGGGSYVASGTLTLSDTTISGNNAGGGGGIAAVFGGLTLDNSIVSGNTANNYPDLAAPYTDNGGNVVGSGSIALSALGNYGGPTQTMLPEPGSSAICAGLLNAATGSPASVAAFTDQRGAVHSAGYCSAGQLDAGAVQTSYSLGTAFTQNPPSVVVPGTPVTPNPPGVTVTENGLGFSGAPVTMSAASGALGGTNPVTSATNGLTTFTDLTVTGAQPGDTLTATLSPLAVSVTSSTFSSLTLSAPSTLTGQAGVAYSQSVTPANGTGPYTYSLTSGSLPNGLTLTTSGTGAGSISGTSMTIGSFPVTVQVTDTASSATASASFTLVISAPSIIVGPVSLPTLTVGASATLSFTASGGTSTYTFYVSSGFLPLGLSLSSFGSLSGTPTTAGAFSFTITAPDSTTGMGSPFSGSQVYSGTVQSGTATINLPISTTVTYNGSAQPVTASTTPTGLTGLSVSYAGTGSTTYAASTTAPTNAGSYTVTATLINSNYSATPVSGSLTINKATAMITLGTLPTVYTGSAQAVSAMISPSSIPASELTFTYTGTGATTYGPSSTPPTAAGSYTVAVLLTDANYSGSNSATFTINTAPLTATAGSYSGVYDGATHALSACAVSANPDSLTCTNSPVGPVGPDAGTATVTPIISGAAGNYTVTSKNGSWSISALPVTITAGSYNAAYDGSSHSPSACTSSNPGVSCSNSHESVGPDAASGAITPIVTIVSGNAADYSITSQSGSYAITQTASTTTISCPTSVVYTGSAQTPCTATVTGAGGLSQSVTVSHTLNTNVGTATASATYAGDTNHTSSTKSTTFSITAAPLTVTAGSYSGVYDGATHTLSACTVSANPDSLTCTNSPVGPIGPDAGTAIVTPIINGSTSNYTVVEKNGSYSITQAPSMTAIICPASLVYTGSAQTPCTATVTGAGSLNQSVMATYILNTNVGIATASATYAGDASHTSSAKSTTFTITAAPLTVTAGSYSGVYDGAMHALSACTVSANPDNLTCTNNPVGPVGPNAGFASVTPVISGSTSNYTVTSNNGSWSITALPVTLAAGSYNGVYDGNSHAPSACTSSNAGVSCTNSPASVGPASSSGPVTPLATIVTGNAADYSIVTQSGSYAITQAISVTALICPATVTYNGAAQTPCTATVTGAGGLSQSVTVSYTLNINVGTATASATYAGDGNHTSSTKSTTFSITAAALSVTAGSYSGIYDGATHALSSCTVSANPDNLTCTNSPVGPVGPDAGTAIVTPIVSGSTSNYTIVAKNGSWSITALPVTLTAGSYSGVYDSRSHTPSGCVSGYAGVTCTNNPASVGPGVSSGTVSPVAAYSTGNASDYTLTAVNGSYSITKLTASVTPNSSTKVYGTADPQLTGTLAGFLLADNVIASYTRTTGETVAGSPYTISATLSPAAVLSNYTIAYNTTQFSITKASATITLGTLPTVYTGSAQAVSATISPTTIPVSELTFTYTGTGATTYGPSSTPPTAAGSYTVAVLLTDANYTGTVAATTYTQGKATPALTWTPPTAITYGTGLGATQLDAASSVTGSFNYTPGSGTVLGAGSNQALQATFTPTDTADYVSGGQVSTSISVNQAVLTVTANSTARPYGMANPTFTGGYSGQQNGDTFLESYSTAASMTSNPGLYSIVPSVTGTDLTDYTLSVTNGTLTIGKANTTTGLTASSLSVTPVGTLVLTATVLSATTGTPSGLVTFYDGAIQLSPAVTLSNGQAQYTVQASSIMPGVQHVYTASYAGDGLDFNGSVSTAGSGSTVTVLPNDFSLTLNTGQVFTVVPGQSISYTFQMSPQYALYPSGVTFTLSGLPPGATATFAPSSVAASAGPQTVVMTIQTAAAISRNSRPSLRRSFAPVAFGLLLLPLAGLRRSRRHLSRLLCMGLLVFGGLASVSVLSGCGASNGFFNQAVRQYPISVTASSGGTAHTVTFNLTVQ